MMAWIMDMYMNTVGHVNKQANRGVVTGKPVVSGGTLGREKATGQGVVHCILEWAREHRFNLEGSTYIVQGYGNVGSHASTILGRYGASLTAVGDHSGYLKLPGGLQPTQAGGVGEDARQRGGLPLGAGDHPRGVLRDEVRHLHPGGAGGADRRRRGQRCSTAG
jgi:glutamate dehydrogenase (NAD(P)+)